MKNGKGDSNSALSQILIPVVIALLVGGTAPWWWQEFITRDTTPKVPPNTSPVSADDNSFSSSPTAPPPPSVSSSPRITLGWGNVDKYFLVDQDKVDMKRGYETAPSQLEFLLRAKGSFSGSLYAYFYDEDGVKICPIHLGLECLGYEYPITFSTKSNDPFFDDLYNNGNPFNYLWQQGEVDRASLSIPHNATKIEFFFIQRS